MRERENWNTFCSDALVKMSTSSATKQKAKLLVKMANAVEDSSTRRRNELQQHYHVDSESVEELLRGLEDETYSTTPSASSASSRKHGSTIPHRQQQQHRHHPVDQYQVQILYKAMISYRENAHLRYLLLELRHLDLKQSFVELESRYRRLETEQEAWKQSCQAAAAAGAVLDGPIAATVDGSPTVTGAHNTFQTSTVPLLQQELRSLCSQRSQLLTANLELRKHLKQAQIDKLQQQPEKQLSSSASPDQVRGIGAHQQPVDDTLEHLVEQFQSSITSIGLNHTKEERRSGSRRPLGEEKEAETEGSYDENDDNEEDDGVASFLDQSTIMRENRHADKMNLLGMQLSTRNTVRDDSRSATINRNSDRQAKLIENQQQSILWSPPPANQRIDQQNSDDSNERKAARTKAKMAGPTLTSFLPMPQRPSKKQTTQQQQKPTQRQQQMQDIQWSARNVTHDPSNNGNDLSTTTATSLNVSSSDPREFSLDPNDYQESGASEIDVTPREIPISPTSPRNSTGGSSDIRVTPPASREFSVQRREIAVTPQPSGMNQFGMLDEYGRAISSRSNGDTNNHNVSGHSRLSFATSSTANTNVRSNATKSISTASKGKGVNVSLFRRLSGGSLNESEQEQTLNKKLSPSQAPNPPPTSATTDSPVEYQMSGYDGSGQPSVAMQATTRRRISNDTSGSVEYQVMPGYQASGHTSVAKSDHCPTTRRSATGKSNHLKSIEYPMPGYQGSGNTSVAMSDPLTPTRRRNTHASDNLKSVEYSMPGYQGSGPPSVAMSDPSMPTQRRNTYANSDNLKSVEYSMPGYQGGGHASLAMSEQSPKSRRSSRGNTSVAMSDHSPRARRSYIGNSDHVISPSGRTPIRRQLSHDNKVPTPPATTRLKVTGGAHGFRPSLAPMSNHSTGGGGRSRDPQSQSSHVHMQDHSHRSNSAPAHHHTHQRPRGHPSRARSSDGKMEPQAKPPSYFERIKKTLQQEI